MSKQSRFIARLGDESRRWVDEGIVSSAQADAILGLYDPGASRRSQTHILVTLGYLFLGLALIVLIGANWADIPRGLRMGGVVALTMGVHAAGLRAWLRGSVDQARRLAFLGNLCFGAAIILISQIYHLGEHMPDGVFFWAAGSMAVAAAYRSGWLGGLALLLAMLWGAMEALPFAGYHRLPLTFPIFWAVAAWLAYREPPRRWILLSLFVSAFVWLHFALASLLYDGSDYRYGFQFVTEQLALTGYGFVFLAVAGRWLEDNANAFGAAAGLMAQRAANSLGLLILLLMTMEDPIKGLIRADIDHPLVLALVGLPLVLGALHVAYRQHIEPQVATALLVVTLIFVCLPLPDLHRHSDLPVLIKVVMSLVAVAIGIAMLRGGYEDGNRQGFFGGLGLILSVAMIRYVDLVDGYLSAAALFVVFALVLLGAARKWDRKLKTAEVRDAA